MTDTVSASERSRVMSLVKSKGSRPEMTIRRLLHGLGYRYRLHRRDLPGNPDMAFVSRKKAVFVNGCFWHNHAGCPKVRIPATNRDYWLAKLARNGERDERNRLRLQRLGWEVATVWECQLREMRAVSERLVAFLGSSAQPD